MKNKVIEVLNRKHGKKVIKWWRKQGVDTKRMTGINTREGDNPTRYYGVIDGEFASCDMIYVNASGAEIITLPKKWKPKRGDKVLVRNNEYDTWLEMIFLTKIRGAEYPYVVVAKNHEEKFIDNKPFCHARFRYMKRIKHNEPQIDFSIINDKDWFYMKTNSGKEALIHGAEDEGDSITYKTVFLLDKSHADILHGAIFFRALKNYTIEFRLATLEEKQMVFDKYPELRPIACGDFGVFWDTTILDYSIGKLNGIDNNKSHPYLRYLHFGHYKNFRRINPDKPLREQVPELFDDENK